MWRRGKKLGQGAFASVYIATLSHNRAYSIQAVKTALVSKSKTISREKELLEEFDCPYIIRSFGSNITTEKGDELYNLFLEYASGGTLLDHIRNTGGLPEFQVKRHASCILSGLDYIHKKGYVHCDIKPENILRVQEESALAPGSNGKREKYEFMTKIADFGLAKKAGEEIEKGGSGIRGTAMYLAPESFPDRNYEPKVDIWAFGCTVLEMLTGSTPWDRKLESPALLFKLGFTKDMPKIPEWVSGDARDFLEKCLVRDPKCRWSAEGLLKHPFLTSSKDSVIGEKREVLPNERESEENSDESLSVHMKPYFDLVDSEKRKRMRIITDDGIKFGLNRFGLQCGMKKEANIPYVNTCIEIFD